MTNNALVLMINVMTIDTGRSPRTLRAVMTVIADDFHVGETRGYPVLDCTKDVDDRARSFRLKTVLLYVSADYPAQRLASGFSHSGKEACHYCEEVGRYSSGVSTIVHGDFYRWLPAGDPDRDGKTDGPPMERNNARACVDALRNEAVVTENLQRATTRNQLSDQRRNHYAKTHVHGINNWCPLAVLDLFDVIWDFVFDIMHAADAFKRFVVPTMKGERRPTMLLLATDGHVGAELETRKSKNRESRKDHDNANKVSNIFFFFEITRFIMH